MRVLVVGAYGFVGAAVARRLAAGGHAVSGLGRSVAEAKRAMPFVRWIAGDLRRLTAEADWAAALADIDAVVNCAGALQDNADDDLTAVHRDAVVALASACAKARIRLAHISAIGADAAAATLFMRTKGEAEAALAGVDGDWLILRPGLVLGPTAYGASALLRGLAAAPGAILAVHPEVVFQVVAVEDVAEACARALDPGAPARTAIDLVHPQKTRVRDIVVALRGWLGLAPAPVVEVPAALAAPVGWLADAIAWLGWRSPMRTTALAQLAIGVECDAPAAQLGVPLKSLTEMLAGWPAGPETRWFARLYLLKPVVFVTLVGFWIASGLIGLSVSQSEAIAILGSRLGPVGAQAAVIGGGIVDIALGLAAAYRATASVALTGMVVVALAYLAGATLVAPALWADPLGPLVKVLPGLVLALVAGAILRAR